MSINKLMDKQIVANLYGSTPLRNKQKCICDIWNNIDEA